jgi:hypothetical protein
VAQAPVRQARSLAEVVAEQESSTQVSLWPACPVRRARWRRGELWESAAGLVLCSEAAGIGCMEGHAVSVHQRAVAYVVAEQEQHGDVVPVSRGREYQPGTAPAGDHHSLPAEVVEVDKQARPGLEAGRTTCACPGRVVANTVGSSLADGVA